MSKFRKKSTWIPPISEPALESFLSELEKRLLFINEVGHNYSNLSNAERSALRDLKTYQDIVIKPADKGFGVMNLSDYKEEAFRQLNDSVMYENISRDRCGIVASLISNQLKSWLDSNYIDKKCSDYLQDGKFSLDKFYLLPRIHKNLNKG